MDCKYILQNELHEKYLLGRLSEEEIREYLNHLQTCQKCKHDLESEEVIINGLRSTGHKRLKDELRKQIAEARETEQHFDWTVLFKAAAVLLFVALIPGMFYYTQFYPQERLTTEESIRKVALSVEEEITVEPKLVQPPGQMAEIKTEKMRAGAGSAKKETKVAAKVKTFSDDKEAVLKAIPPDSRVSALETSVLSGGGSGSSAAVKISLKKPSTSTTLKKDQRGEAEKRSRRAEEVYKIATKSSEKADRIISFSKRVPEKSFKQRVFKLKDKILYTRFFIPGTQAEDMDIFTDSLRVKISGRRGKEIILNCYLPQRQISCNLDSLKLEFVNENLLQFYFPDSSVYEIDLQKEKAKVIAPSKDQ